MVVLLVGICSEGSVWLVREVRWVPGVGNKTKNWVDCNNQCSLDAVDLFLSTNQGFCFFVVLL